MVLEFDLMIETKFNFLIGGPAGAGIEKSGKLLSQAFARNGYEVFSNGEHMSQIRGGNNFLRVRVSDEPLNCHQEKIDVIIALDAQTIVEHIDEVCDGGAVIFDGGNVNLAEDFDFGKARKIDLPLKKIATDELGNPIMANVIALGVVCGLIGFDVEQLKRVLKKIFEKKSAEIVAANEKAADKGVELAAEFAKDFAVKVPAKNGGGGEPKMLLDGNSALAIGAVKAGCKYVGEYPMTPSSSVLHFMAAWAEKYGIVVKHTEDEIAAVNSVIGAGFAGVRAMTATSGGGFALMSEGIGLASMNEVPIVMTNVMRPGPATGQPTRSGQGDLRQVIHAGQDDPVKIVVLPGDIEQCFYFGFEAFNWAEKYQVPVILAYDKYLGESLQTHEAFDQGNLKIDRGEVLSEEQLSKMEDYKRYLNTESGVSPRALPGTKGGIHRATSDEHNEYGEIYEGAQNRKMMVEKRMRKLEKALDDLPKPMLIGEKEADVTFVTWSSCKSALLEAVDILAGEGVKANILQVQTAWPFHKKEFKEVFGGLKRAILVEENFNGQMGGLIAEQTGIMIEERILRYDGRPLTAQYILDNFKR